MHTEPYSMYYNRLTAHLYFYILFGEILQGNNFTYVQRGFCLREILPCGRVNGCDFRKGGIESEKNINNPTLFF